jgi:hypothetical protein
VYTSTSNAAELWDTLVVPSAETVTSREAPATWSPLIGANAGAVKE